MQGVVKGSLARRVLMASFLMLSLPLLIYFLLVFRDDYYLKLRETVLRLSELGESRALILSDLTRFNFRALDMVEEVFHFGRESEVDNTEDFQHLLSSLAEATDFDFISYYTITPDGRYICSMSSDSSKVGRDYTEHHYVQNAIIYDQMSFLAYGMTSLKRRFYVTKTIYSEKDHRRIGILTMATSVDGLIQNLISNDQSSYPVECSLLTEDHVVFASSYANFALRPLIPVTEQERKVINRKRQFGGASLRENNIRVTPIPEVPHAVELEQDGVANIAFFLPISGTNLTLLLHVDKETVFAAEYSGLYKALLIFFVVIVVCMMATLWITWRMSKPMESLLSVMEEVRDGNMDARYPSDPMGYEINLLGDIFNNTITQLIANMQAAENERVQKETFEKELKIGYEIQTTILPSKYPAFPGVELAAHYLPAKEVGGDFYDIFVKEHEDGKQHLMLTVADAAGKGISACLYSLVVRSMLRSNCVANPDIRKVMKDTNNLFLHDTGDTGFFVTALTTVFDPETKELTYSSCGHNPALLLRNDGVIEELSTPGISMGVVPFDEVTGASIQLYSGNIVVYYTDGVTECLNKDDEEYGMERLQTLLRDTADSLSAQELVDRVMEDLDAFAGDAQQHDDITLLVMKVL